VLAALVWSARLRSILRWAGRRIGLKKITALGAEVEFSAEGARELGVEIDDVLKTYRAELDRLCNQLTRVHRIEAALETLVHSHIDPLLKKKALKVAGSTVSRATDLDEFRCTLHVRDGLIPNSLRQLANYYPGGSHGRGRVLSIRYGIIGKAYRSREPQYEGDVRAANPTDLILEWALTDTEVEAMRQKPPCVCAIPLIAAKRGIVGVFYMDTDTRSALDGLPLSELASAVRKGVVQLDLIDRLVEINKKLEEYRPEIPSLE
jgi:hypothetical protein